MNGAALSANAARAAAVLRIAVSRKDEGSPSEEDIRCPCGKLVARWEELGIAIKCTRCGRLIHFGSETIRGKSPLQNDRKR